MNIPAKIIIRDLLIFAATLGLWSWTRQLEHTPSALTMPVSLLTGAMTAFAGFLTHEWGHLLGAHFGRSAYLPAGHLYSVFLFKFNSDLNTRGQFLGMSMGGFISSAVMVALLFGLLSLEHFADRVALGLTVLGVLATFILEVPTAWRVYKGAPIPRGVAFSSAADPA